MPLYQRSKDTKTESLRDMTKNGTVMNSDSDSDSRQNRIIWICVGKKDNVFQLSRETLERSKYLRDRCKGIPNGNSEENPFFIDKDGELFGAVLKVLRNPRIAFPSELRTEVQSYEIDKLPIQYTKKEVFGVLIVVIFLLMFIKRTFF